MQVSVKDLPIMKLGLTILKLPREEKNKNFSLDIHLDNHTLMLLEGWNLLFIGFKGKNIQFL